MSGNESYCLDVFGEEKPLLKICWGRVWSYGDRRKGYCTCVDSVVELEKWCLRVQFQSLED